MLAHFVRFEFNFKKLSANANSLALEWLEGGRSVPTLPTVVLASSYYSRTIAVVELDGLSRREWVDCVRGHFAVLLV